MNKIIKYHGEFRDLIPKGWKFVKTASSGYKVYFWKRENSNSHLWIYVAGRELEIEDYYQNSWIILNEIITGSIEKVKHARERWYNFYIDEQSGTLRSYVSELHDPVFVGAKRKMNPDSQEYLDLCEEYYKKYQRRTLLSPTVEKLKGMYDRNLLSIVAPGK